MYYTAAELVKKEAKTRVAILLHCAGPEAQDIHSNFVFSEADGDRASDYNSVLKKFKEYCEYGDQKEKNLRDRIVFGVADTRVKERLLRESDL